MHKRLPAGDDERGGERGEDAEASVSGFSRRSFIQSVGVTAALGAMGNATEVARAEMKRARAASGLDVPALGPDATRVVLKVNGREMVTQAEPGTTLLEALRWHFNLTGTKAVCDRGACGACSVHVDGKLVCSCMYLAHDAIGKSVRTIEGLASGDALDPVQEAFIRHDALQCGFCTPGLIMASRSLLDHQPKPTLDQIREGLSGNLCRCGTYTNVFNAVLEASGQAVPVDKAPLSVPAGENGRQEGGRP